jgi:hypothetical protein
MINPFIIGTGHRDDQCSVHRYCLCSRGIQKCRLSHVAVNRMRSGWSGFLRHLSPAVPNAYRAVILRPQRRLDSLAKRWQGSTQRLQSLHGFPNDPFTAPLPTIEQLQESLRSTERGVFLLSVTSNIVSSTSMSTNPSDPSRQMFPWPEVEKSTLQQAREEHPSVLASMPARTQDELTYWYDGRRMNLWV